MTMMTPYGVIGWERVNWWGCILGLSCLLGCWQPQWTRRYFTRWSWCSECSNLHWNSLRFHQTALEGSVNYSQYLRALYVHGKMAIDLEFCLCSYVNRWSATLTVVPRVNAEHYIYKLLLYITCRLETVLTCMVALSPMQLGQCLNSVEPLSSYMYL